MAWILDESDGRAMRLPTGPVDDDNRWPHCWHCDDPCLQLVHDEPCPDCHATPRPEEE